MRLFCSIVEGSAPSWGVYEDDVAVAFLDIVEATAGHTLVVPRKHSADIWSLSEDEAASRLSEQAAVRSARSLRLCSFRDLDDQLDLHGNVVGKLCHADG